MKNHAQLAPRHSKEVELVAREILYWGIGSAIVCTIIVMVI
jgi:hypothetical protein